VNNQTLKTDHSALQSNFEKLAKEVEELQNNNEKLCEDNTRLCEDNEQLCKDLFDIKAMHEKQVLRLGIELQSQRIKSDSLEVKLDHCKTSLRRTADYMTWWRILQQYVVVV